MASSKKVRGLLVEIGGDTTKLQQALKDVDKTTNSLNKELRGINTLLKFDPNNTVLLDQKTKVLSENLLETKNRLDALVQAQNQLDASNVDKNSSEYRNLQREIESTKQKIVQLKNETSKFIKLGDDLNNVGKIIYNMGEKIDNVGTKVTTGLTLPIVALSTYAIESSKNFESAFAGVRKTVSATEEEYSEFRQGILDMSKELPATADEISAVAEAAGQLGIHNDSLLSFTRTMIDLGESTNLTSDEAASSLARLANITQMSQNDFDKLGSTIVALGNNFATTESEIVAMALRLAGAGKQVGLSEAQILGFANALSSVGIEAEMGGSAFSKVMLNIEADIATNSESLETWAKVAGMSMEEFKSAWGNDAASVLANFIEGLGNIEQTGENAILILDELGLSEVRVRDTLLRASNASNIFTDSLELSSSAWEENSALTKEATERYKTSESQMKMTINKARALAIEFGDELLPHVNDLLDVIGDLIDQFSNMTDEEQQAVLKTAALVAGIGPAIKIIGNLGKVIGSTSKGIGTFIKAMTLAKNGIGDATGKSATLAKGIQFLTSTTGRYTLALGALTSAYVYYNLRQSEEEKRISSLNKKIMEQTKLRNESNIERKSELEASLTEIDRIETLTTELGKLVEENGKVKEGYETRVQYILNEMNQAFGTEYKIVDGMIQKYEELANSIDLVIAKTRAQSILNTQKEDYEDAQKNIDDYTTSLLEAEQIQKDAQKTYDEAKKNYDSIEALRDQGLGSTHDSINAGKQLNDAKTALENANATLYGAQKNYEDAMNIINTYETNSLRIMTDDVDQLNEIIASNTRLIDANGQVKEEVFKTELSTQIRQTESIRKEYEKRIKDADEYEKQVLNSNRKMYQQQLNDTIQFLIQNTSVTEKNSQSVINTWKYLAENSVGQYQATLYSLPEDTRTAVVKMTGVAYDESVALMASFANMAITSTDEFNEQISKLSPDLQDQIRKMVSIINENGGEVTNEVKDMVLDIVREFDKADIAELKGLNFTEGFASGILNERAVQNAINAAVSLAQKTLSSLSIAIDEGSPSRKTKISGKNFTKGFTLGILDEKQKAIQAAKSLGINTLTALDSSGRYIGKNVDKILNREINNTTKAIFTTPNIVFNVQTLNKENLELAFNYVNKKFGSQY